jgi:hypothetical protein
MYRARLYTDEIFELERTLSDGDRAMNQCSILSEHVDDKIRSKAASK